MRRRRSSSASGFPPPEGAAACDWAHCGAVPPGWASAMLAAIAEARRRRMLDEQHRVHPATRLLWACSVPARGIVKDRRDARLVVLGREEGVADGHRLLGRRRERGDEPAVADGALREVRRLDLPLVELVVAALDLARAHVSPLDTHELRPQLAHIASLRAELSSLHRAIEGQNARVAPEKVTSETQQMPRKQTEKTKKKEKNSDTKTKTPSRVPPPRGNETSNTIV